MTITTDKPRSPRWRGERVLLAGRVPPDVREAAHRLAEQEGLPLADLLAELVRRASRGAAAA
ncbi:MAG: hypothetical protein ACRDQZ_20790 [Mycobacteriales bacterium]